MRNFKSILLFFLFFLSNYTFIKASELLHICRIVPPSLQYASNCNPYGGVTYFGGEDCEGEILMKVYLSNLSGYNNLPLSNVSYTIPAYLPDLYVSFDSDFDGICDTQIGPITDFKWNGLQQNGQDGGTHYVFEHDINLADYLHVNDPCSGPGPNPNQIIKTELVRKNNAGEYSLFEIEPFSNFDDVISCEVFHEACKYCFDDNGNPLFLECDGNLPSYNVPICFDCTTPCNSPPLHKEVDNNEEIKVSKIKSEIIPKVSPNPFQGEIVVEFNIQKEAPVRIEIIDLSGMIVFNKTFSSEIGNRRESIDLEEFPKGIYFLKIIGNNSSSATKIVKQ